MRNKKGISLIVLVITIIVMVILAGAIIITLDNSGIINKASEAVNAQNIANEKHLLELAMGELLVENNGEISLAEYVQKLQEKDLIEGNIIDNGDGSIVVITKSGYSVKIQQAGNDITISFEKDVNIDKEDEQGKEEDKLETISKTDSYLGYYVDVDGDKVVDGVIYADLAVGGSGNWNSQGTYWYNAIEGVKDYYISGTYDGDFGDGKGILTAIGEGEDRFYVMSLADYRQNNIDTAWKSNVSGKYNEVDITDEFDVADIYSVMITDTRFGEGKNNTKNLIKKFNSSTDTSNLWVAIRTLYAEGWFVPSNGEWLAFLDNFDISSPEDGGLSDVYWTSSEGSYGPKMSNYWTALYSIDFVESDYRYILDCLWEESSSIVNSQYSAEVRLSITY